MFYGEYNWNYYPRQKQDLLLHLLDIRGIKDNLTQKFLSPSYPESLHDPFLLSDMEKAIKRIILAKKRGETVGIFADYDADGIPGAVLLREALEKIGLKTIVYLPQRSEGYGLSKKGLISLKEGGATLIISVDLGITNRQEVEHANSLGLEVIVTDHHEVQEPLFPDSAVAVINPRITPYPYFGLSGAAVAWKLLQALGDEGMVSNADLKWGLDLVGLSLIADMMPLLDESRTLTIFGLKVLRISRRPGIRALAESAGVMLPSLDIDKVGFVLAPRLNAAGRIGDPFLAYQLLASDSFSRARVLAAKISGLNRKRQEMVASALSEIETAADFESGIILARGNWNPGITGLLAGRLADKYSRPAIVLTREGEDYKGSIRIFGDKPLLELFKPIIPLTKKFGGHKQAGGLTVGKDQFLEFSQEVKKLSKTLSQGQRSLSIDCRLEPKEISQETLNTLSKLEPFGQGNPNPCFSSRLEITDIRRVGKDGSHLQFSASGYRGIAFYACDRLNWWQRGKEVEMAFTLKKDDWNGGVTPQIMLLDSRL